MAAKRKQLARVTGALDLPRGPDVRHRIRVDKHWFDEPATIELELPRNLACAACEGGGCDNCERSGAISIRGRKEPAELLRITLPRRDVDLETTGSGRSVVVRIPGRGGIADKDDLPRGMLLLQLVPADEPDAGVCRVEPVLAPDVAAPSEPPPQARPNWSLYLAVAVILWILLLIWLRLSGRG
ncbi:MAG TPA: hypothetical protein PKD61_18650 [Polyangiaceae bacterium]|nr:hypothetical protein [Polyangiaceae bacterium]